ncbi:hypothetical protein K3495_g5642 [Podosphaera aphanis]|nr:hypothetical protein K3495_g5642 [Podosphaera aphanis]
MAVTTQAPSRAWSRWPEQHQPSIDSYYAVDISGIIQTFDPRNSSRAMIAQHYAPLPEYNPIPLTPLLPHHNPHQPQVQQNQFSYHPFHTTNTHNSGLPFANAYLPTRHTLTCPLPSDTNSVVRGNPFCRPARQGFVIEEEQSQSNQVKNEAPWTPTIESPRFPPLEHKLSSPPPCAEKEGPSEVTFKTEVDTLMKAIQSKVSAQPQKTCPALKSGGSVVGSPLTSNFSSNEGYFVNGNEVMLTQNGSQDEQSNSRGSKKRYHCTVEGCTKSFYQKTHLDIHERAHTGVKPYSCKQPGCGRRFSQLGNLKTHERRHTGERPFGCDSCGKRFAQRGNVRAHMIVHDHSKPYVCKLDDCGKQFTQLGNLKSHQNKFHIATLRALTAKFASIQDGDLVHAADKELWEYFADLYKNSNKGIKGRGKDRKVGSNMTMSSMRSMNVPNQRGYSTSGPSRGNLVVNLNLTAPHHLPTPISSPYEMFDVRKSPTGSGSGSSIGTCYEDAPSDSFDENGRNVDMSFSDRTY